MLGIFGKFTDFYSYTFKYKETAVYDLASPLLADTLIFLSQSDWK